MIKASPLQLLALWITVITISAGGQEPANDTGGMFVPPYEEIVSISGTDFLVIDSAVAEFTKHNLDIRIYDIVLNISGDGYWVSIEDPQRPPSTRGSSPRMSEFSVLLDRHGNVLNSHFVR